MRFIPLTEGGSIDYNNSTLDESVRADKLVVRGIVNLVLRFSISSQPKETK